MILKFNWVISSINEKDKTFIVNYKKEGSDQIYAVNLSAPLDTTVDLNDYINKCAPLAQWENENRPSISLNNLNLIGTSDNSVSTSVKFTLDTAKTKVLKDIASWRYRLETGGIIFNGYSVNTSRQSQSMILSTYTSLKEGLVNVSDFKITNNTFVQLDLNLIGQLAKAVAEHVQGCFTLEKDKISEVNRCTTVEEVLAIVVG